MPQGLCNTVEVVMTKRPKTAVVVITHDERQLERAVRSLIAQHERPDTVFLWDNGTIDAEALSQIRPAAMALVDAGISLVSRRSEENLRVGAVRARIFHEVRASDADLVTCLDADDEFGVDVLAAMQATYLQHRGKLDVIVPREIALRYDSDPTRIETLVRTIPDIATARPNATDDEVRLWAELTRTGATFAIRVGALAQFNGFSKRHLDDEWVWKLTGWGRQRARFVPADIAAVGSYQYWQHDCRTMDPHAERRQLHSAERRFLTARRALRGKP